MTNYPTKTELNLIQQAAKSLEYLCLMELLEEHFTRYGYARILKSSEIKSPDKPEAEEVALELVTGGWSGNEEIIDVLSQTVFWGLHWVCSYRGGSHLFYIPKEKLFPPKQKTYFLQHGDEVCCTLARLQWNSEEKKFTVLSLEEDTYHNAELVKGTETNKPYIGEDPQ